MLVTWGGANAPLVTTSVNVSSAPNVFTNSTTSTTSTTASTTVVTSTDTSMSPGYFVQSMGYGLPPSAMGMGVPTKIAGLTIASSPAQGSGGPLGGAGLNVSPQLTTAVEHLYQVVADPIALSKTKGNVLRPEYYSQHLENNVHPSHLDHKKLSFVELMYGCLRVNKFLRVNGGDHDAHTNHMLFLCRHAMKNEYKDIAYSSYDHEVTNAVMSHDVPTYIPGYTVAAQFSFSGRNERRSAGSADSGSVSGTGFGKVAKKRSKQRKGGPWSNDNVPDGWPEALCYDYNYGSCEKTDCSKDHVCRVCSAKHRAMNCNNRNKRDL